ncbi:MAG: chain length determinant protein EpsF [Azoarcus sp.]|jgi:chain length determinant protein EpsF|nr:chain length determinant protein EpsF [Azoarcus sp.]
MTFKQFLLILRARRWIVYGIPVCVVLLVALISAWLPYKYTATVSLVVERPVDPVLGQMQMASGSGYLPTQIDIIESARVAGRVVELFIERNPYMENENVSDIWKEWYRETKQEKERPKSKDEQKIEFRLWLARLLQKQLDVRPSTSRESSVINISYTVGDARSAADIANMFASAYMDINLSLNTAAAGENARWFREQTKTEKAALDTAKTMLSDYEQKHGIVSVAGRLDLEANRLLELNSQLTAAEAKLAGSRSRRGEGEDINTMADVISNPVVSTLTSDLNRLSAERSQLLGRLGENHPQVREINDKIREIRIRRDEESKKVKDSLGTSSRSDDVLIKELTDAIEKQRAKVLELREHQNKISVLQSNIESAQKAYDLVYQRTMMTTLESRKAQQTNISVLTPATPPADPSSPKIVLNIVLAVFLGVMLGIGVALLLELLDQRVRGGDDLMQCIEDVPFLGIIPGMKAKKRRLLGIGVRLRPHPAAA